MTGSVSRSLRVLWEGLVPTREEGVFQLRGYDVPVVVTQDDIDRGNKAGHGAVVQLEYCPDIANRRPFYSLVAWISDGQPRPGPTYFGEDRHSDERNDWI